jgi:hypothetical protein
MSGYEVEELVFPAVIALVRSFNSQYI